MLLKLVKTISNYVEGQEIGEVFVSPVDVYLDETTNAVQPDILFVSHNGTAKILENNVVVLPTL
jgi:hypothetical protein